MPVKITTNYQPREILDWLPKEAQSDFDYINWNAVFKGHDSVSFVKFKGEYYDLNQSEGLFPHDKDWWYNPWSFGCGILFKLVEEDGEYLVVCGTYIVS